MNMVANIQKCIERQEAKKAEYEKCPEMHEKELRKINKVLETLNEALKHYREQL